MKGFAQLGETKHAILRTGTVIPAHPLALDEQRRLDERHQRALTRYYAAAGAGGVAVAVHTTQFEIREPGIDLLRPVLELAAETLQESAEGSKMLKIAGVVGRTEQAVAEAELARSLGYDAVLMSPGGLSDQTEAYLLERAAVVGEILPVIGFYLQEAVGGRYLSTDFWRGLADQESTIAIKAAPFDRYRTVELVQGTAASDRADDVILYTGNDDNIVGDLTSVFMVPGADGRMVGRGFAGGLLGHWSAWTRSAANIMDLVQRGRAGDSDAMAEARDFAAGVTDSNAALFDVRNNFAGVIAGVHEVLRRQGLMAGTWCLNPDETLSPGQAELLTRVSERYPWLQAEDDFVAEHLDDWLR